MDSSYQYSGSVNAGVKRLYGIDTPATRWPDASPVKWTNWHGTPREVWVSQFTQRSVGSEFKWFRNSGVNLQRALVERLCLEKGGAPLVRPLHFSEAMVHFTRKFRKCVVPQSPCDPRCYHLAYTGRKRAIYYWAGRTLQDVPLRHKDSFINGFVKKEKVNVTAKVDPVPRCICPRTPRYNFEVGRYLKHLEKIVIENINQVWKEKVVLKGYNAQDTAELLVSKTEGFRHWVAYGIDCVRMDAHVSAKALRWEHSIYDMYYNDPYLRRLLSWQLHNTIYGRADDLDLKLEIDGGRMSGDMNTSLGNTLIMCGLIWSFCHRHRIRAHFADNGDDCILFLDRSDARKIQRLPGFMTEMGFPITLEKPVSVIEHLEFCQAHPVFDGSVWTMVRNYPDTIAKDAICMFPLQSEAAISNWLTGVGEAGIALAGSLPIYSEFYNSYIVGRRPTKRRSNVLNQSVFETGFFMLAQGMNRQHGQPTEAARESFAMAFGIGVPEQLQIESLYRDQTFNYFVEGDDVAAHLS